MFIAEGVMLACCNCHAQQIVHIVMNVGAMQTIVNAARGDGFGDNFSVQGLSAFHCVFSSKLIVLRNKLLCSEAVTSRKLVQGKHTANASQNTCLLGMNW